MTLPNKNAARKPRSHSGWSSERRARQSAMMKSAQIWKKSTGPRTKKGKARSALNATKHGHRGREWRRFYALLARQRIYVRDVVAANKINRLQNSTRQNATNELLKQRLHFSGSPLIKRPMWTVAALYRFVEITDLPAVQAELKAACEENGICGTILIAPEGVNGTIAGIGEKLDAIIAVLDRLTGIKSGELKYSTSTGKPFLRMKVRVKKEIITMAAPEANPAKIVGQYVEAEDWNALIADPDVTLIDTRNDYETAVGIFKGAIDPKIEKFTDFKNFVAEKMDPARQKKVAMFCTGGIRCEKASAYMLAHGFEEVYHLKGGILKYLETVPADQSQWDGECFVFDRRVAVGHGLTEGIHDICYGCRFPLSEGDKESPLYEAGVSCPRCHAALTNEKAASLRMRHAQFSRESSGNS
jgi:UPF0176 protein